MSLKTELGLKKSFTVLSHEAILNIYCAGACIKKQADVFFRQFGLTDVQFNVMMLLVHQGGTDGLSQADLSRMMLVNPANVTGLIDRMEKTGFLRRIASSADRRRNTVKLTAKGKRLFAKVEPLYAEQIKNTMSALTQKDQKSLIKILEKVRNKINK